MNGWLGFCGILNTQTVAISCLKQFITKVEGMHTRNCSSRMNIMEEIFWD